MVECVMPPRQSAAGMAELKCFLTNRQARTCRSAPVRQGHMSSTKIVTNAGAINCSGAAARMEVLERFGILDTERDEIFDGIADLAAALFDAPVAVVNFIANGRQFFKAEIGIGARELPLASSICVHALAEGGVFVVPDLAVDDRFAGNPLVAVQDGMRFYAGYVLESDGVPIGAVCVLDRRRVPKALPSRNVSV